MRGRITAYLMLSIALAATVFCYTLLQGIAGSRIAGASPQRRYFTLGVEMGRSVDYALSAGLAAALQRHLPHAYAVTASQDGPPRFSSLALPDGSKHLDMALDMVRGQYFRAVALDNVLGRVISPAEERANEPVIMINRVCANALFGSAPAALDRDLTLHLGGGSSAPPRQVRVIGVVMGGFAGIRAYDEHFRQQPVAWVPLPYAFPYSTLLSVPAGLPDAAIRHDLDLAWNALPQAVRGVGSHGLVFSQPYSTMPDAVAATTHKLGLYRDIAGAALLLTLANLLAVNFLEALRRRAVHAIERTLGATRAWQLRRVLYRALLGALVAVAVSGTLLVSALMVAQHALAGMGVFALMDSPWGRVGRVLHPSRLLPPAFLLLAAVVLIEVLVHGLVMARDRRATASMQVSGPRGERQFGGLILVSEFTLAMLFAVLAGWGAQYAWRMAHEDQGMLHGSPLTLLSTKMDSDYLARHPDAFDATVQDAVLAADLRRAITGVEPHAVVAFGPVLGVRYRHSDGNFHNGSAKLEAGRSGIVAQKFVASTNWLPVSGARLLAGRNFSADDPEPDEILIDAEVARALFGSAQDAVGRQVHTAAVMRIPSRILRVRGVIASLRLDGPGHAPVASWIAPLPRSGPAVRFMGGDILVRPEIPAARGSALLDAVRRVFARDMPYVAPTGVESSARMLDRLDRPQRTLAIIFWAVAAFGVLIALTGLTVFLRLFLALRRRVDAIWQALGAGPRRLYAGVVVGVLVLGLAGGLLALLFTPWLAQQFALLSGAQVAPFGWPTWLALAVLLLAVFAVAHFPARRAARAEPAESLHEL